jgi:hypothetical protein
MAIIEVATSELTPRPKDGRGRFVSPKTAALWAVTCQFCGEPKAQHTEDADMFASFGGPVVLRCPDNDVWFEACDPAECLDPTTDEVGCDCAHGFC